MPSHATFTDQQALRTRAYADGKALETRRSIYRYRRPALDLVDEVVAAADSLPTGLTIDVGCGSGAYTKALRQKRPGRTVLGFDLSPGMVRAAGAPGAVVDAMSLPLPDNSCAIALALHMLYHVSDPDLAVGELARVSRPDGGVIITGNAAGDKTEFNDLWLAACRSAAGAGAGAGAIERFQGDDFLTLDEMETLATTHFQSVRRIDFKGETVVPDAEPVIAFLESTRALRGIDDHTFDLILRHAAQLVRQRVVEEGMFRFTNHIGLIIGTRPTT